MSDAPSRASDVTARWTTLPGGVIDGGEIVVLAIKPSLWRPVFDSAAWLATSAMFAVTLTMIGLPLPGLSPATTAQLVLLIGFTGLGLALVRWTTTWHVLTNRRIIDIHGVRTPQIAACLLVHVRNTYLHASVAEKVTRLGTITFVTDEPHRLPHLWRSIAHPDEVHAKIRRAIENAIDQSSVGV
ncbi:MAG: hypothetical protein AAB385_04265 [Planctomycetota bacterium]